jgi:protein-S-isoprenylcysteine O-methyltransferase Ste14
VHFWLLWATAGIWIAFVVYWSSSPVKAAPSTGAKPARQPWISVRIKRAAPQPPTPGNVESSGSRESARSRSVHQTLLLAALLLGLLPGFWPLNHRWLPDSPWIAPAGLGAQIAFALLYIWSRRHLGRYWSGAIMTTSDHQLVRSGPYRILRHPMYTAILGMLLGTAMVSGELHALLALVIGVAAYWRKIRLEEPHLRQHFGEAYESYQRNSWALIPGLL